MSKEQWLLHGAKNPHVDNMLFSTRAQLGAKGWGR
jgi:hypothetical protein